MSHVIFKIGPLENVPGGVSAYFVFPGRPDLTTFFAQDDESALREIVSAYGSSELEAEMRLASTAKLLGIPSRGLERDETKMLGVMTFELALPGAFSHIQDQSIFHHLGVAAAIFYDSAPWERPFAHSAIKIELTGSDTRSVSARLLGISSPNPGIVLFDGESAVERVVAVVERGAWAELTGMSFLGMTLEESPRFASQVMRRVYNVPRLPTPVALLSGERVPIEEIDALALAASLRAVSVLTAEARESHAQVATKSLEVWALAYLSR